MVPSWYVVIKLWYLLGMLLLNDGTFLVCCNWITVPSWYV